MPAYVSVINSQAGSPSANSYCDIPTATKILTTQRLYAPEWLTSGGGTTPNATQDAALIWSTELLDRLVDWDGFAATLTQNLRWPRSGVYSEDGYYVLKDTIPDAIKIICAEFAYELVKQNRVAETQGLGTGVLGSVRIGPLAFTLEPHQNSLPIVPEYLRAKLAHWGILSGIGEGSGMMKMAKLLRV